ncbi:MAG: CpsD/CapB family tyrosine-protein kinase, partial [Armatimonadetes bacterium]|nr:CpsD/CapB family tyrosine-protein kinase [Armatimonadota bacterium]
ASARAEATVAAVALSNAPPVPGVPVGAEDRLKQVTLEQVSARRTLEDLEKQKRDISLRKTQQEQNTRHRQMQVAQTPMAASSSRSAATLIISVMLALVLATLLTFAQEVLDDRINKPDDLERITQLPALAHVPTIPQDQPRLLNALAPNSHVAEAYRGLRSSIYFAAIDSPVRRIMVTSASKGEGKSITSVNLATVMAMEGKRVILVDADLRKPSIHRLLEVPNDHGLSEVLAGLVDIKDVIQETGIVNLRTVCAGPIPPNPAEALSSSAFDRVVDYLEEIADVVIYDTTPCTPVTDPLVIARQMDGVILVVYMGQTRKGSVKQALELLGRSRARLLGLVYNRARHPGNGYYGYGYYGYYGYGTYGNEDRPRNSRNASVAAGSRDRKALGSEGPRGSAAAPRRRVDS